MLTKPLSKLRLEYNLDAVIFFMFEDVVAVRSVFELHFVSDDE